MADDTGTPAEPRNVIEALARVIEDLPAIGRDGRAAAQQGGYAYRGIEQITAAASPLFARHGIVFVPRLLTWERDRITVGGKPWTDDRCTIEYDVYGPGGPEDRIVVGPIPAVGRDNSDKGTNKAMTQAWKYALLQVLCVSDQAADSDGTTHEADAAPEVSPEQVEARRALLQQNVDLRAVVDALPESVRAAFVEWKRGHRFDFEPGIGYDDRTLAAMYEWLHDNVPDDRIPAGPTVAETETGDGEAAAAREAADLAATPCARCGSVRSSRVLAAGGEVVCARVRDCEDRQALAAEALALEHEAAEAAAADAS